MLPGAGAEQKKAEHRNEQKATDGRWRLEESRDKLPVLPNKNYAFHGRAHCTQGTNFARSCSRGLSWFSEEFAKLSGVPCTSTATPGQWQIDAGNNQFCVRAFAVFTQNVWMKVCEESYIVYALMHIWKFSGTSTPPIGRSHEIVIYIRIYDATGFLSEISLKKTAPCT